MTRSLRVLSGSRPLSRRLGDAGLRHFFLDAGECRFARFFPRFPNGSHVYPLIVRASSSYSSPKHHDRSGEEACLFHYARMSVQLRPTLVFGLDMRDKRYDDAPQMIVRKPTFPDSEGYPNSINSPWPDGQARMRCQCGGGCNEGIAMD
jgi:hypothetical protein